MGCQLSGLGLGLKGKFSWQEFDGLAVGEAAFVEPISVWDAEGRESPEIGKIAAEGVFVFVDGTGLGFGSLAARAVAVLGDVLREWIWIGMGMLRASFFVSKVFAGAEGGVGGHGLLQGGRVFSF